MSLIYEKFVTEQFDENGRFSQITFHPPENFNFAYDVVDELAKKEPNRRAMLWISHDYKERTFTFADMMRGSNRAANYFKSLGIKKGDIVMLILKRHYEFWYAILGLHKIGAIALPGTHQLKKKDLVYRFNAAGVKAIVCTLDEDIADSVDAAQLESPTLTIKSCVHGERKGWSSFEQGIEAQSSEFERPTGEEAFSSAGYMLMYFTSGTEGYPKIVAHNFYYPLGHITTARYWQNVVPDGLHFTISETGWAKSVWGKLYGQWLCEAGVFVYDFDKFDAADILGVISKYKITTLCAPPTMYRFFIHEDLKKYDLSHITHATIAGEALNAEVYNKFYNSTGIKLMEGYGQTESTLTVMNMFCDKPKPGSMGRPNPQYEVQLFTGDRLSEVGEVGEIVLDTDAKHPCGLFMEYYRDPNRTKRSWHDGHYHTGDMAWRDEDGYFWFVGRADDLIKSSGYRIGPFEIESVLMEHRAVMECAVTGAPDPIRGEVVKATIVLAKGYEPSEALKKDIQSFVKKSTAPYKYPRIVEFVQELPKTISGKIRRVEIRGTHKGEPPV